MAASIPTMNPNGMESPKSDQSQTRYSTPISDLDDHRHPLPARSRRETMNTPQSPRSPPIPAGWPQPAGLSSAQTRTPDLLQVNESFNEAAIKSRDFEHAIVDDDTSIRGEQVDHKNSLSPTLPRRSTVRRSRNPTTRSRESSPSSRSSSPANSVDAFAGPRRRERANTVGSRAPSDLDLGLQRTISGGTHRRRPTFNNGSVRDVNLPDDRASFRNPVEEDGFSVVEEFTKTFKIDFEELDEFVAQQNKPRSPHDPFCRQKLSFSSHGDKPRIFHDVGASGLPKITRHSASPSKPSSELVLDDSDTVLNEKIEANHEAALGGNVLADFRPSFPEPVRYSFFSSELEQNIHAAEFGDLLAPGETFRDLFDHPGGSGVWWLDIQDPTKEELECFQRAFGIHRLTIEDIITQEAREKVELFHQYYFVCFRSFFQIDEKHEDYMEPVNVYMVVFREGIITVTYKQSPHAANVRKRIGKQRGDSSALTADWICYAMIDDIVDMFGPPIRNIEVEADNIEDNVFVARNDDFATLLRQIGMCRKKVMSLMRLLGGKADVIKHFAKRCNEQYSVTPRGDIGLYLGDIQDHVVTMMSNLGHFEKMLSRSHSNYLAQLSVDHMAQGSRANEVLSKITVVASILVPLNLICGLFGMNVNIPGKEADGLGWFFGIIGVIAAFVLISLAIARKYRFI